MVTTARIKGATNPITIPYASEQILSGTQITDSMISTMRVPPSTLKGEILTNKREIVGKYTASDVIIPKGSLFYKRAVVDATQAVINPYKDPQVGYERYTRSTSTFDTYGNAIIPGNYVDIWITGIADISRKDTIIVAQRFHEIVRGSIPSSLPCCKWLSIRAAIRLFAIEIA